MCVCVKRAPGYSPIHSDVISSQTQVFSPSFGKCLMDKQTDISSHRDAWMHFITWTFSVSGTKPCTVKKKKNFDTLTCKGFKMRARLRGIPL